MVFEMQELYDGTRIEFQITVPHHCGSDEIAIQVERGENTIAEETSDPAAILSLRRNHESHTEKLPAEVRTKVKTTLQLKS